MSGNRDTQTGGRSNEVNSEVLGSSSHHVAPLLSQAAHWGEQGESAVPPDAWRGAKSSGPPNFTSAPQYFPGFCHQPNSSRMHTLNGLKPPLSASATMNLTMVPPPAPNIVAFHSVPPNSYHPLRIPQKNYGPPLSQYQIMGGSALSSAIIPPQAFGGHVSTASDCLGKPAASEVIGNTSWRKITTTTGVTYFFNKKTKQTVWTCPDEIAEFCGGKDVEHSNVRSIDEFEVPYGVSLDSDDDLELSESNPIPKTEEGSGDMHDSSVESSSADDKSEDESEIKVLRDRVQRMEEFKQMLREENFGPFALFDKCLPRLLFHDRFRAIAPEHRRRLFDRCIKDLAAENRRGQKEHVEALRALLEEASASGHIHATSTVDTLAKRFGHDKRWHGSSVDPTEWASIRARLVNDMVDRRRSNKSDEQAEVRRKFKKLIRDSLQSLPQEEWPTIRRQLRNHPHYIGVASAREREKLFKEICDDINVDRLERRRGAPDEREEVEAKRLKLAKGEAATAFTNMLVERIKNPFVQKDGSVTDSPDIPEDVLRSDPRFSVENLTESEKRDLFDAFVIGFTAKRVEMFAAKLTSLPHDDLTLSFQEVLEKLQTEKRFFQGIDVEKLQQTHERWRENKYSELKDAFNLCLRQVPDISRYNENNMESLVEKICGDVRYQRLDAFPDRRDELIRRRLMEVRHDIRRKGPSIATLKQAAEFAERTRT